jgi:hypothetical protein
MFDQELDLSLVQIALRAGFACTVTAAVGIGAFFFVRFLAGSY